MKKSLALGIALTAALSGTCAAHAANMDMFSDVPAGHWAYDSIAELAADGVIEGYGDGTFRGDRPMTRYEMAQLVEKAMRKGEFEGVRYSGTVDRLAAEFADELTVLNRRVDEHEKKLDNFKLTGEARFSYSHTDYKNAAAPYKSSNARLRTDIVFSAQINNRWTYVARLENNQYFHRDGNNSTGRPFDDKGEDTDVEVNRAFLKGRVGTVDVVAGRAWLGLAKGLTYDSSFDGVYLKYGNKYQIDGFYGKLTNAMANNLYQNNKSWGVHALVPIHAQADVFGGYDTMRFNKADNLVLTHMGVTWRFGKKLALTGMWLHSNMNRNGNGAAVILDYGAASFKKPGSFGIQAVYYNEPARFAQQHTMEGDWWSQNLWDDGFKGYSLSASYGVADGMVASVKYFDIQSRADGAKKNKTLWSELKTRF